jgi:hypothetical protein
MADAAGGMNLPQIKALARLRRERERRALQDLVALRQREAEAELARDTAGRNLETEKHGRRDGESQIYRSLAKAGPLQPGGLERHREAIRRLSARVDEASGHLDAASTALVDAGQAVDAGRTRLTRRMRDRRKWEQIESRLQTMDLERLQTRTEREIDDDIELRYGRLS